eukprot:TRINITY_DN15398_c0_g1_i1.p1 TRINITY_DN15398_c0_g1~~TRINITY_DN15398_c0_g1_i1.p1  ORF type:complete len:208 (-),score=2.25 TRINITY_DN15398_c0_g1_i1:200-823(-)
MTILSKTTLAMAKARKLSSARHERFLGGLGYGQSHSTGPDHSDFGEEDVWSMVEDVVEHTPDRGSQATELTRGGDGPSRARHWLARENRQVGGLSLAFEDMGKTPSRIIHQYRSTDNGTSSHAASSAPVNVPDWPKFLRVDSIESLNESGEEDETEWIPPHEYLAREYARNHKMAATSVFEGVGRTLKGRDMSRVRNAVWSQTGFLG